MFCDARYIFTFKSTKIAIYDVFQILLYLFAYMENNIPKFVDKLLANNFIVKYVNSRAVYLVIRYVQKF